MYGPLIGLIVVWACAMIAAHIAGAADDSSREQRGLATPTLPPAHPPTEPGRRRGRNSAVRPRPSVPGGLAQAQAVSGQESGK